MRRGQFVIIFAIIFLGLIMGVMMKQYRNRVVIDERARLEDAFLNASDAAAEELALGIGTDLESTLMNTSDLFFHSLVANLNLYKNEDLESEINLYVPILAVTMEDGFYLCILERVSEGGNVLLRRRWTECIPYSFEDAEYIYRFNTSGTVTVMQKTGMWQYVLTYDEVSSDPVLSAQFASSAVFTSQDNFDAVMYSSIVSSVEKRVSLALNTQAYIAGDLGLNIAYACPSFLDILPKDAAGTFFAIYQGLPSREKISYTYNGVKAASFVKEKQLYYVADPVGTDFYRLAHKAGCAHLTGSERERIDRETAIHVYGAYGCPDCILPVEGFMSPP